MIYSHAKYILWLSDAKHFQRIDESEFSIVKTFLRALY